MRGFTVGQSPPSLAFTLLSNPSHAIQATAFPPPSTPSRENSHHTPPPPRITSYLATYLARAVPSLAPLPSAHLPPLFPPLPLPLPSHPTLPSNTLRSPLFFPSFLSPFPVCLPIRKTAVQFQEKLSLPVYLPFPSLPFPFPQGCRGAWEAWAVEGGVRWGGAGVESGGRMGGWVDGCDGDDDDDAGSVGWGDWGCCRGFIWIGGEGGVQRGNCAWVGVGGEGIRVEGFLWY